MVFNKPLQWGLFYFTHLVSAVCSSLAYLFSVVVGNAANEVHCLVVFLIIKLLVGINVSLEELGKAIYEQFMNGRILPMTCAERAKACKETVRQFLSIDFLYY